MRMRYRMFRRSNVFWIHDGETGKQGSLRTRDRREAEKILHAKNEPQRNAALNLQIGRAYLAASDPQMMTRTWKDVMEEILALKSKDKASTLRRWRVAVSRLYKDGEEWKSSESFGRDDLPLLCKVADQAHTWIFAH